jgi:hypothetical protein
MTSSTSLTTIRIIHWAGPKRTSLWEVHRITKFSFARRRVTIAAQTAPAPAAGGSLWKSS